MLLDTPQPETNRRPSVVALEFWRDYEPDPEKPGEMRAVDFVRWARRGDLTYASNVDKVSRIRRAMRSQDGGSEIYAPEWIGIKDAYEAWVAGQEAPVDGTPLDAWPALTKAQVAAFRAAHYRSVEDIAEMADNQLSKVRLPDMRLIRDKARTYVASKRDTAKIEAMMADRDRRLADMEVELSEARSALERLAGDQPRRGPGRPRKNPADPDVEDAA